MALRLRITCPKCEVRLEVVDWDNKEIIVICPLCRQKMIIQRRKKNGKNNQGL